MKNYFRPKFCTKSPDVPKNGVKAKYYQVEAEDDDENDHTNYIYEWQNKIEKLSDFVEQMDGMYCWMRPHVTLTISILLFLVTLILAIVPLRPMMAIFGAGIILKGLRPKKSERNLEKGLNLKNILKRIPTKPQMVRYEQRIKNTGHDCIQKRQNK